MPTPQRFAPNYPAPQMWLQAVLAVPGGAAAPGDLASDLTDSSRRRLGRRGDGATGLPSASTMLALRAYWQDAA